MPHPIKNYLVSQFRRPRGPLGRLAGTIMGTRDTNVRRNAWAVRLMELAPSSRVLEVGFGPGVALQQVCARVTAGKVVGLDHSATMTRMAARRNHREVASGLLTLVHGSVQGPEWQTDPALQGPFDRIFAVNVVQFWPDPVAILTALASRLAHGGSVLLVLEPRMGDLSAETSLATAARIAHQMEQAGLTETRVVTLEEVTPMVIGVLGRCPPPRTSR